MHVNKTLSRQQHDNTVLCLCFLFFHFSDQVFSPCTLMIFFSSTKTLAKPTSLLATVAYVCEESSSFLYELTFFHCMLSIFQIPLSARTVVFTLQLLIVFPCLCNESPHFVPLILPSLPHLFTSILLVSLCKNFGTYLLTVL